MNTIKITYDLASLEQITAPIIQFKNQIKIFAFEGSLGVGKTTVIQAICSHLGVTESVVSPTFTYVNRYKDSIGKTIYHFDLYRIKTLEQFYLLGFEEYLVENNAICFIEWPEVINPLLKELEKSISILYIKISYKTFASGTVNPQNSERIAMLDAIIS